ncbi:MAG: hypothetical protein ACOYOO_08405 [Saprospiraceae bacterium]
MKLERQIRQIHQTNLDSAAKDESMFLYQSGIGLTVKLASFALAAFSMVRYFKKRRKSTETAYQYIIFSEELNTPKDK